MTLEDWLKTNCPEIAADVAANGCWDYRIFPMDGESMNVLTVHISTGRTARIKTYCIAATLKVEGVTWAS